MYSKKVMEHFMNPRNAGEIEKADGVGIAGNMVCGDVMQIFIKVNKSADGNNKHDLIEDIKFKTMGCAAAIATSSMITEIAMRKTAEEGLKITMEDVADALDGLPPVKMHCSNLALDALAEAIYDYFSKNNYEISEDLKNAHKRIKKEREYAEHLGGK
ncbi:MAG: iron-sulfur cluster assembly scaffold protein [Candidatus Altiarchaeum hamiconexum]|uniref:Iron-sulfur cluster assembly scaffold protein n=1 Tax=Candidatus Altarchaeum hamiconexum TaxID=1803513 RepID=A0A8J8CFS2_9ARCH|nr:iron-sulfur cluster assembly scaffold protein [Candidatus Altarchaeum hamiconexum]OIQ04579.1 MAG: iron-sulfur cluster assembly scaffold protein [Candidatus Altarchaeum sp. CG2_30_32_3053]PIV26996.1 MAG: iron-sulfur cluster assembly scaffold protein [Candidatus Altarchaeum sp. CG03_land_8_20_14_0_80_32_618]PJC13543.1 MAG: iron-sulfur cluster assembly scaffold protein [Candidatus Altarchaeum sp. CG_4_9_14_0_8_um_filter_32_206]NCN69372.1 iron-sulfur cluster assembly scaffold protein [Candidatus